MLQPLFLLCHPFLRGAARSRPPDDILREAERLAQRGIREIIITAQDTTGYGWNLKGRPRLSDLLNDLTQIKGIEWIRLLYAHPARITADLLSTIAENDKICSYIDLPIQHIDDAILNAMKRKVNAAEIRQVIAQIRHIIPDVALRTSLITGFPARHRPGSTGCWILSDKPGSIISVFSPIPEKKAQKPPACDIMCRKRKKNGAVKRSCMTRWKFPLPSTRRSSVPSRR